MSEKQDQIPVRIAVASENGLMVHQHFGRATQFMIFEVADGQTKFVETRKNLPACGTANENGEHGHGEDPMQHSVSLVADCRAVVVSQIGPGAVEKLSRRGVIAFVIPDFIDRALPRLLRSGELQRPVVSGEKRFRWLPAEE